MSEHWGFFPYEAINYKAAQTYLDRKAAKGLQLKHIYMGAWARFETAEHPLHFVDLDIQNDDLMPGSDYLQLCADAGWEHLQALRGMYLFRAAPGASPVPIQTDGELEWERFWDRYRPRFRSALITLLCLTLLVFLLDSTNHLNQTAALASNAALLYFSYLLFSVIYPLVEWIRSRWYLARCRRSGKIETPGRFSAFLDGMARFYHFYCYIALIAVFLNIFYFDRYVDLDWYPMNNEYTATVETCREYPVVLASDLGLQNSDRSRRLEGFHSILVDFLEYSELTDGHDPDQPFYILTTERYQCANEFLAKIVIRKREQETRVGAGFLWGKLEWEPAEGLGFDESYTCLDGSYLLFRQDEIVALVGCTGMNITTSETLSVICERILQK